MAALSPYRPAMQRGRRELALIGGGGECGEGEGCRVHTHPEKPKGTGGLISPRSTDVLCSHNLPILPFLFSYSHSWTISCVPHRNLALAFKSAVLAGLRPRNHRENKVKICGNKCGCAPSKLLMRTKTVVEAPVIRSCWDTTEAPIII
jgi:hypothetical protein